MRFGPAARIVPSLLPFALTATGGAAFSAVCAPDDAVLVARVAEDALLLDLLLLPQPLRIAAMTVAAPIARWCCLTLCLLGRETSVSCNRRETSVSCNQDASRR